MWCCNRIVARAMLTSLWMGACMATDCDWLICRDTLDDQHTVRVSRPISTELRGAYDELIHAHTNTHVHYRQSTLSACQCFTHKQQIPIYAAHVLDGSVFAIYAQYAALRVCSLTAIHSPSAGLMKMMMMMKWCLSPLTSVSQQHTESILTSLFVCLYTIYLWFIFYNCVNWKEN